MIGVFVDIIVPVFILIGIGVVLHRVFHFDLYTLAKVNIYFVVPGFIFLKLYETAFSLSLFLSVLSFFSILIIVLYLISTAISRLFGYSKSVRASFTNSILFYNSGNYGVPVNDLVFKHDPYAMSIQVIILTFQNILTFSWGIFALKTVEGNKLSAVLGYFKMPVLYAMVLGIGLNLLNVEVPEFVLIPANYIADAMVALALVTLGAQVAQLRFAKNLSVVYVSLILRLVMGPAIAFAIIYILSLNGVIAQALLISSAMPTAVNSAIIAQEYENEPELAAQIVLASTVFSMVTVTVVIAVSRVLF
ncbi:AEC family transporter [Pseudalkalibacillus hwajinpoensis]|uniref:AEC family transporter n=1 Tax=Guptibacillus hwajinpoensis TaxID=208199 RepID=A0A4U1MKW9_9BACL|nr:AEC family transporter [Pseudalkalibacillus hwajinpoensis]TKD72099.1 AEC family transporter [Pseudalkalibacillus hwajinpoensis]